jgi:hypothetical protein
LETWTVVAWLADSPHQITEYRDHDSLSWYAAHTIEAMMIVMSLVVLVYVVRACRRERRILTFDAMFCLCGATMFWADALANFFVPMWLPSSNFVNLNYALGHMPFVVNPDAGRMPHPILFSFLMETFAILGLAIVFGGAVRRAEARWPRLTRRQLVGLVILAGCVLDVLLEISVMLPLHLWTYAAPEALTIDIGQGFRMPFLAILAGGIYFGLLMSIRIFKDDRGRAIVERGLDGYSPRLRKGITLLALYGAFQVISIVIGNAPIVLGPYETFKKVPSHVLNDTCDAPGVTGTRYGQCPGAPGFRMPGRTTAAREGPLIGGFDRYGGQPRMSNIPVDVHPHESPVPA